MEIKAMLLEYWQSAATTEGWYPPYADALSGVDAAMANWRPEGAASNTIWETVVHVTYFKERLLRRLDGEADLPLPGGNDDTFVVSGAGEPEWQTAAERLFRSHQDLYDRLQRLDESQLEQMQPEQSIAKQVMDLIVHDAYHTGQIILIRKLKGHWPERRSFL